MAFWACLVHLSYAPNAASKPPLHARERNMSCRGLDELARLLAALEPGPQNLHRGMHADPLSTTRMPATIMSPSMQQISHTHAGPVPPLHRPLQDIEITRGYVPGYSGVLGHEFVGSVVACSSSPQLVGQRVVGEINCNDGGFSCADAVYQRNHAPGR